MLFNTITYAYFFAAVFVIGWLLAPWRRARLGFLLMSSYVFYAGWTAQPIEYWVAAFPALGKLLAGVGVVIDPAGVQGATPYAVVYQAFKYVPLLFVATSVDWLLGVLLGRTDRTSHRKAIAIGTVLLNLGILVYFKYWNWGADSYTWLAENVFQTEVGELHNDVELPAGISFFCFMSLSYVIDVYRRTIPYCKSYLNYLTYISFFPHLVAGPIIRGRDLLPHLQRKPRLTAETGSEGLFLIAQGLFKKVVIGDYIVVNFVDRVFAEPTSYSSVEVLTAMYGFAVQVYCDFSGYSDVAIGCALLLGYRFKLNFDQPFKSLNIVEFWRRWHISLSTWLRDYVYIPMGGGRKGRGRKYFNMFFTMVVCGVWHGAAWTYLVFGCIQGAALAVTHWFQERRGKSARDSEEHADLPERIICIAANFTFVAITFTMFKSQTLALTWSMYERLFSFTSYTPNLNWKVIGIMLLALALQWTPRRYYDLVRAKFIAAPAPIQALCLVVVAFCLREAATAEAVPFVYFEF